MKWMLGDKNKKALKKWKENKQLPWPAWEMEGDQETFLQTKDMLTLRRGSHVVQNLIVAVTQYSKSSLESTENMPMK